MMHVGDVGCECLQLACRHKNHSICHCFNADGIFVPCGKQLPINGIKRAPSWMHSIYVFCCESGGTDAITIRMGPFMTGN
jgi:hypothetical protein